MSFVNLVGTAGTNGGPGKSVTANASTATHPTNNAAATGGRGGSSVSASQRGGAGGDATATATTMNGSDATASATGGAGGRSGGDGGVARDTTARVTGRTTSDATDTRAMAVATGGDGGLGDKARIDPSTGRPFAGGNGGAVTGTAAFAGARAFDRLAEAKILQFGGNGGAGMGADGGSGASSDLTDAATGYSNLGYLTLRQESYAGDGGHSTGGQAGRAGDARSALTFDDTKASYQSRTFTLTSLATGGTGGGGSGGSAGRDGGVSTANALGIGAHKVEVTAIAGAEFIVSALLANGGAADSKANGGHGGMSVARASAVSSSASPLEHAKATAIANGGIGGSAEGKGYRAGNGGGARATARADNAGTGLVSARIRQIGGDGGTGRNAADGGNGSSTLAFDAVTAVSAGGLLWLYQDVFGGNGGGSDGGRAGSAGNAVSRLTFDDRKSATLSRETAGSVTARAGLGGTGTNGSSGSHGGASLAAITVIGTGVVSATAFANDPGADSGLHGGLGSRDGGNGGAAVATSTAISFGSGREDAARARTSARAGDGGEGGVASGSGNGGAGGSATGAATATATGSHTVDANVATRGGNGGAGTGAGHTGGMGGIAAGSTATVTNAFGAEAYAWVSQRGGSGGDGRNGANGGDGRSSVLVNGARGSTDGRLSLDQRVWGGSGGASEAGTPGAAGHAVSKLDVDQRASATPSAMLVGYAAAYGGVGGSGTAGVAGRDGGLSIATVFLASAKGVSAHAVAGDNNNGGSGSQNANGARGGVSFATAQALGIDPTGVSTVSALSEAFGGTGGSGDGIGHKGGDGGQARARASASAAGPAIVSATATQIGGQGGFGANGADAGIGGASVMDNAATGVTNGGSLTLSQFATGGRGGTTSGSGKAGAGGGARSTLRFDDTRSGTDSARVRGVTKAVGGTGGDGKGVGGIAGGAVGIGATGGSAIADTVIISTGDASAQAEAIGGAGGRIGGAGGRALALSSATGTTFGSSARAVGGTSAQPAGSATAIASGSGGVGTLVSSATSATDGPVPFPFLQAWTQANGPGTTKAQTAIIDDVDPYETGYQGIATITAKPSTESVNAVLDVNDTIDTSFGAGPTYLAMGQFGGSHAVSGTDATTISGAISLTMNAFPQAVGRNLLVGLFNPTSYATGFETLDLIVTVNAEVAIEEHFTSVAAANGYFDDHVIDFGVIPEIFLASVQLTLTMTLASVGDGYTFGFMVGAGEGLAASDTSGVSISATAGLDAPALSFLDQATPPPATEAEGSFGMADILGETITMSDLMPDPSARIGTHAQRAGDLWNGGTDQVPPFVGVSNLINDTTGTEFDFVRGKPLSTHAV